MKRLHPRCQRWIEVEVAPKLAEGKIRRLERHHPAFGTNQARQMQRVRADIGADVQHQRRRFGQLAQGNGDVPLELAKSMPCERSRS
jgi:hypothetical protein